MTLQPMPESPSVTLAGAVPTILPNSKNRTEKGLWIQSIITPILGLHRYTRERAAAIAEAVSREYVNPRGKLVRVSDSQIRVWLNNYERKGFAGIQTKPRNDIGKRRVLITRTWDKACPLDAGKKHAIAETLAEYIRSLWASGAPNWTMVQFLSSHKLEKLSREAGWDAPLEELKPACVVARPFIEQQRWRGRFARFDPAS